MRYSNYKLMGLSLFAVTTLLMSCARSWTVRHRRSIPMMCDTVHE